MTLQTLATELNLSAPDAAKRLLGCELERTLPDGKIIRARTVETEAYDEDDPGSHTYRGRTQRNAIMFGPAGFMYVYFIYGMHYCCNVVTGPDGHGEAVLIRAVEPLVGEKTMAERRKGQSGTNLTNGPSKLCLAMDIDKTLNAHDLTRKPLKLILKKPVADELITQTNRIGLSQATDVPWRFYLTDNQYVSKK